MNLWETFLLICCSAAIAHWGRSSALDDDTVNRVVIIGCDIFCCDWFLIGCG